MSLCPRASIELWDSQIWYPFRARFHANPHSRNARTRGERAFSSLGVLGTGLDVPLHNGCNDTVAELIALLRFMVITETEWATWFDRAIRTPLQAPVGMEARGPQSHVRKGQRRNHRVNRQRVCRPPFRGRNLLLRPSFRSLNVVVRPARRPLPKVHGRASAPQDLLPPLYHPEVQKLHG